MKKIFTFFAALCTMGAVMAQTPTIVSTEVQKRNVLIEEFTGWNCGYCPDGHYRANLICEQYDGHAWAINIHQGGYATGSGFTTTYGDNIASLWNVTGWPSGVTNRCNELQNRGQWAASAAEIRNQNSPVNIGFVGTANDATREVSLHLEVYYTGDGSESTQLLNIAVLQNNILAYQSNYGPYNTDYIIGDQYCHMHMLRDLMTGQWGVSIPATQGTFIDTTITYTVPASINGVEVPTLDDLEFVAFITENSHKNVITAQKADIPAQKASLFAVRTVQTSSCALEYGFEALIQNRTVENITSVTLNVDGTNSQFDVNIPAGTTAAVNLPSASFSVSGEAVQHCSGSKSVSFVSYAIEGGSTVTVNSAARNLSYGNFDIYTVEGPFTLRVGVDHWGSEASVEFLNQSTCTAEWTMGPWNDLPGNPQSYSQIKPARYFETEFNPAAGLYILRVGDSYGDGWRYATQAEPGGFWLSNAAGSIASMSGYVGSDNQFHGDDFSQVDIYLNVTSNGDGSHSTEGIDDVANVEFGIYPNPATDRLNISCNEAVREVSVIDMTGRTVINSTATNLNVSGLAAGVYMVRIATENGIGMQKFVKE